MRATAARERDTGFVAFMESAQPGLLRAAFFLTGSADLAHELTQDALGRTYLAWPRIRPDGAYAYARRILANQRVEHWRKRSRELPMNVAGDRPGPADGSSDDRDEVVRLLLSLPEQQRKVVVLRYYLDLPEREVAEVLSISVGTVKSAASRGLSALRAIATQSERTRP